jgi:DNA repair protein RecO (recombination protein O)
MSKTYKATGINLTAAAFGESDRLVTILTREFGLIRAIAPGARKHHSSLGGRSGMFVVNELLIAKGRSLDKITQAQTVKSYPGLAKDLVKLTAGQYLAEIVLCDALSEQPQEELFVTFNEHLSRLEALPNTDPTAVLAHLVHGVFQLLVLAGLAPQVQVCCLTQRPLVPDFTDLKDRVGFSINAGGTICLKALEQLRDLANREIGAVREASGAYQTNPEPDYETIVHTEETPVLTTRLCATELAMFQQLPQSEIMPDATRNYKWLFVERVLRQYAQYHFGRLIRSAALIDSYFAANHDAIL